MSRRDTRRWFRIVLALYFCAAGMMLLFRVPLPPEAMGLLAVLTGLYAFFYV